MRGLAVLEGYWVDQVPATGTLAPALEARAFRAVAMQPPLYAWLEAIGLALGIEHAPAATVLPSYLAGALIVLLVYWHGQLWRGAGVGLVAAMLTAFNPHLLIQMKVASPATLAVAATLAAMYAYGRHFRVGGFDFRGGGRAWVVVGGLALGVALLTMGLVGLLSVPVVLLHQFYLRSDLGFAERRERPWYGWWNNASLVGRGHRAGRRAADRRAVVRRDGGRIRPGVPRRAAQPAPTRWAGSGRACSPGSTTWRPRPCRWRCSRWSAPSGRRWCRSATTARRSARSSGRSGWPWPP